MKKKTLTREDLHNIGSLITYQNEEGEEQCLGDLWHSEGHGTYDPYWGKVEVSKEEADIHNKALDQARLKGLDENCEVGQGGFFYFAAGNGVFTFSGTEVTKDYTVNGNSITFRRDGKTYRGKLSSKGDSFNFRRVA